MTSWLLDTLLYTGILIALVLVLRRPVARWFGPQLAYALWSLPLLRLLMPPLVLPESMAPQQAEAPVFTYMVEVVPAADDAVAAVAPAVPASVAWSGIVLSLWAGGALAFLAWRAWGYISMRRHILSDALQVGEAGRIRLVETPAVTAPVAFGVGDKVIALPPGFMTQLDVKRRNLALEHELAHHRGFDLLANIAAQPLLALHWFNPLAWMGWRAMRRDQEAACDARVIARCGEEDRAVYGRVIAGFAAGDRLALAAPMACPVLGEKSIIHRLRSLTMSDISTRRRLAGRALLAGATLALPLTASISYAETLDPPQAPWAPAAPAALLAPEAPDAPAATAPDAPEETRRIHKIVIHTSGEGDETDSEDTKAARTHRRTIVIDKDGEPRSETEREHRFRILREFDADEFFTEFDSEEFRKNFELKHESLPLEMDVEVDTDCDKDRGDKVEESRTENGRVIRRHFVLCHAQIQQNAMANARHALERARAAIERDRAPEDKVRNEVLESLEREIERLSKDG